MTRQRVRQSHLQSMTEPCPTCHGTGRVFTPEVIVRRVERSLRRMVVEGKRDNLLDQASSRRGTLRHGAGAGLRAEAGKGRGLLASSCATTRCLRPDEFKIVVKGAGRDVTQQYAVA